MPMFNDESVNERAQREGAHVGRGGEGEVAWYFRKRREEGNPIDIPLVEHSMLPGDEIVEKE